MTLLSEREQECLRCRVPDGCDRTHDMCGISRGVKYGIYGEHSHKNPALGYNPDALFSDIGFKEIPLYRYGDGMEKFCNAVAKYKEPWMRYKSWENH